LSSSGRSTVTPGIGGDQIVAGLIDEETERSDGKTI